MTLSERQPDDPATPDPATPDPATPDPATPDPATPGRVLVAMSGGVDSSAVAALLVAQGHDVVGVSMRLYSVSDPQRARGCCSPDDLFDARAVCRRLGIPFYVTNDEGVFRQRVIQDFVDEYVAGRTPNPCVKCNDHLKFAVLLERALALRATHLATGHYARIEQRDGRWALLRGVDPNKDQSYFLFGLRRQDLARVRFPLGAMTKADTRALAERYGLATARKAESQEICFVAGSYTEVVEALAEPARLRPGRLVLQDGTVLARHDGVHRYTIGQRRGLGVAHPEPLFVRSIDAESGDVVLAPRRALGDRGLRAGRVNWLRWPSPPRSFAAQVKVRYRSEALAAQIVVLDDGRFEARFSDGETPVTPGQAAVLYDGDEVLGGGWIEASLP